MAPTRRASRAADGCGGGGSVRGGFRATLLALVATGVAGCAGSGMPSLPSLPKVADLNPFAEKQKPLPGRRIPVLETGSNSLPGELAPADGAIVLAPQAANTEWSQPGGTPGNAPGNLVFSGTPRKAWSADAGTGSSKTGRVMAPPIVYDGRAYTLDASGLVRAFNLASGGRVWQTSLIPEAEAKAGSGNFFQLSFESSTSGGFGGGLAADGGRLIAASGFGKVVALDPATGKQIWQKNLGTPLRAAPTAVGDRVFIVTMEGRFFCLSGVDGAELWTSRGIPQQASRVLHTSPAVDGDVVVVPFPTGDLMAMSVADGSPVWTENLAKTRSFSQLESLSDAARPVIDNGVVYAVGHGGRMIATNATTGERIWSIDVAGVQAPWVSGDSVFVVDTAGRLFAVARDTGAIRWTTKLQGSKSWSGPTMAANALWLVSDTGMLVGVDALTGRIATQQSVGSKMFIQPVVAQGRMLLLTDSAELVAFN